jgi:hypothetical protein
MTISDKAIQKVVPKKATGIQYESKLHKTASQYREYQSDPISFVDKYGEGAVEKLMAELNRPIGVTDENVPITTREHLDKNKKGGRIKYQYGGMADMSAAPMIKQPQQKKRKASGFRTKYSKGGGVRASKYKL